MKKLHIYIYSIVLFLVLMPSLHLFFFYTHGIAKFLIFVQFCLFLKKWKNSGMKSANNILILIIVFYLFSQSLGIINSSNVDNFIYRYKNYIFELLFFFNTISVLPLFTKKAYFFKIILLTTSVNVVIQLLIKANVELFTKSVGYLFDASTIELIRMNFNRGRVYFENYNEAFLPLYYYLIQTQNNRKRLPILVIIVANYITSFFSMFRTRLVMLVFGLLYFYKNLSIKIFSIIMSCFILLLFGVSINNNETENIINRFELNQENLITIESRAKQITYTSFLESRYLMFGIGQGNYLDYFGKIDRSVNNSYKNVSYGAQVPHNILLEVFFESGLLGLVSYLSLLVYFIIADIQIFLKGKQKSKKKALILAFWTLFIYAFFNPTRDLFSYNCIFWFLRANLL